MHSDLIGSNTLLFTNGPKRQSWPEGKSRARRALVVLGILINQLACNSSPTAPLDSSIRDAISRDTFSITEAGEDAEPPSSLDLSIKELGSDILLITCDGQTLATKSFPPTISECLDVYDPNPDYCVWSIDGTLNLDLYHADGHPYHSFLRFDLPTTCPRAIKSVSLQLTTCNYYTCAADQTGEIWRVTPFTRQDLFGFIPQKVGNILGANQGGVGINQTVTWTLPTDLVANGGPVFLGLFAVTSDAVRYWNNFGLIPPQLIIEYQ